MKTRAEPMQQVQLVLHGLITLLAVAACRSESSTGPEPPTAPTHLQGVLARPGETGVITLTTTAAATVPMSAPVVRTAVTNNLTGTLKLAGAAIINLAGTFNAGAIVVSGGGYTITATFSNGKMSGTYNGPNDISLTAADPNGNTVGSASGTLSATSASGTYTSTDRLATGTWSASTASCS